MTNSEKYKTAEERAEMFKKWCYYQECAKCKIRGKCLGSNYGCFYWLNLEAEEEKPLPCPFCGDECKTEAHNLGFVESCLRCGYRSEIKRSKEESIAAHNRVAKAVMESEAK